jgi:hypothetical protein
MQHNPNRFGQTVDCLGIEVLDSQEVVDPSSYNTLPVVHQAPSKLVPGDGLIAPKGPIS